MKDKQFKLWLIVFSLFLIFLLFIFLSFRAGVSSVYKENIIIPKEVNGLLLPIGGETFILKLDGTNAKHVDLLRRLTGFCEQVGIKECSLPDFLK